jgi:hypothetical protein
MMCSTSTLPARQCIENAHLIYNLRNQTQMMYETHGRVQRRAAIEKIISLQRDELDMWARHVREFEEALVNECDPAMKALLEAWGPELLSQKVWSMF